MTEVGTPQTAFINEKGMMILDGFEVFNEFR